MQAFGVFRHVTCRHFCFSSSLSSDTKHYPRSEVLEFPRQEGNALGKRTPNSGKGFSRRNELGLQANCGVTPIFTRPSTNGRSTTLHALSEVTCGRFTRWSHNTGQEAGGKQGSSYSRTRSNIFCMCLIWTYNRAFTFSSCSLNLNTHHNAYLSHL
jgi:hypothetical protein